MYRATFISCKLCILSSGLTHRFDGCRRAPEDVASVLETMAETGEILPEHIRSAPPDRMQEAQRQGVLHVALLQDPLKVHERYYIDGPESEGHKTARRSEQLLQVFLYLHVLAAEAPGRLQNHKFLPKYLLCCVNTSDTAQLESMCTYCGKHVILARRCISTWERLQMLCSVSAVR